MTTSIGIVGNEGAKFTSRTEELAREEIRRLIAPYDKVVSGKCHLGGIDVWSIEEARKMGKEVEEFPPASKSWENGYKPRNIKIAEASDTVVCIVVAEYPEHYDGMRFKWCYHCKSQDHVKSGGCWTRLYAEKIGKNGATLIVY